MELMKKKRYTTHAQRLQLIRDLVSPGRGFTEVKKAWMSAIALVLLRVSSRGSEASSRSMTWTSVCIPKSSRVSIGLRGFAFFGAGSSTLTISDEVDVDGFLTRVARLPVLRAGRLEERVLSTGSSSKYSGKGDPGEDKAEGVDVAVVGPPSL